MKKTFLFLFSFLFLICVACSTSDDLGKNNKLVIYTPHSSDIIDPIVAMFEEKHDIDVEIVLGGTGELLKRIEAEKNNPLGDVLWGGGAESLDSFSRLFTPYKSPELTYIDSRYYDDEYFWLGESPLPMVIMYNKDLVEDENDIKSWNDLLSPKFKGKIAMADPVKSGSSYSILVTLLTAYSDDNGGWSFVEKFYDNLDNKLLSSSKNVFKGVADGEYAVGLTIEKMALKYVNAGANVGIVYPSDGTAIIPDAISIVNGTKNLQNAQKFVDFVLSKEVQSMYTSQFLQRSVRSDVAPLQNVVPSAEIKVVDYDLSFASNEKDSILDRWKKIVVGE